MKTTEEGKKELKTYTLTEAYDLFRRGRSIFFKTPKIKPSGKAESPQ